MIQYTNSERRIRVDTGVKTEEDNISRVCQCYSERKCRVNETLQHLNALLLRLNGEQKLPVKF